MHGNAVAREQYALSTAALITWAWQLVQQLQVDGLAVCSKQPARMPPHVNICMHGCLQPCCSSLQIYLLASNAWGSAVDEKSAATEGMAHPTTHFGSKAGMQLCVAAGQHAAAGQHGAGRQKETLQHPGFPGDPSTQY
jgi:hypothetical protein